MQDPEIDAIGKSYDLLSELSDESKIRVIQWLISKFQLNAPQYSWNKTEPKGAAQPTAVTILPATPGSEIAEAAVQSNGTVKTIEGFENVAECFAGASPEVEWEKALVVAAYLQVKSNLSDITGHQVNKELKNMGHASTNITTAFSVSIKRKPQLMLQMRKEGTSKQAQKKYKVSVEGIKYVNALIAKIKDAD
jgi:hypothetical protein